MASQVLPHVHISAVNGVITMLYVLIGLGVLHLVARRFEGRPFADALLDFVA